MMSDRRTSDSFDIGVEIVGAFQRLFDALRAEVEGLDESVLGWRPAPDTTPISNLVLHTLGAARVHMTLLVGTVEERDRAAEFSAMPLPAIELVALIDAAARELGQYRDALSRIDLASPRERPARGRVGSSLAVLLAGHGHAVEHLAQIRLTKQFYRREGLGQVPT
jgi:hypothetical protein